VPYTWWRDTLHIEDDLGITFEAELQVHVVCEIELADRSIDLEYGWHDRKQYDACAIRAFPVGKAALTSAYHLRFETQISRPVAASSEEIAHKSNKRRTAMCLGSRQLTKDYLDAFKIEVAQNYFFFAELVVRGVPQ